MEGKAAKGPSTGSFQTWISTVLSAVPDGEGRVEVREGLVTEMVSKEEENGIAEKNLEYKGQEQSGIAMQMNLQPKEGSDKASLVIDSHPAELPRPPMATGKPHIFSLPTELWIEIFEQLDYLDLKCVKGVCKEIFHLLEPWSDPSRTKLDKLLFRDNVPPWDSKEAEAQQYIIHPLLAHGYHVPTTPTIKGTEPYHSNGRFRIESLFLKFLKSSGTGRNVYSENATSPSRSSYNCFTRLPTPSGPSVHFNAGWMSMNTSLQDAVTVFDVMVFRLLAVYRLSNRGARSRFGTDGEIVDECKDLEAAASWLLERARSGDGLVEEDDTAEEYFESLMSQLTGYSAYNMLNSHCLGRKG